MRKKVRGHVAGIKPTGLLIFFLAQAKGDANELLQKKAGLEKEKKLLEDSAIEKDALLQRRIKTIGNYVHDSVPVSNNEVYHPPVCDGSLLIVTIT